MDFLQRSGTARQEFAGIHIPQFVPSLFPIPLAPSGNAFSTRCRPNSLYPPTFRRRHATELCTILVLYPDETAVIGENDGHAVRRGRGVVGHDRYSIVFAKIPRTAAQLANLAAA